MRRNNKVLYEQIMRNVSREVKRALNEGKDTSEKIIPFDKLNRRDYIQDNDIRKQDHIYCKCKIDYYAIFKKPKFRKEVLEYIDKSVYDAFLNALENDDRRIGDITLDYYYNDGGYSTYYFNIPEFDEDIVPENSDPDSTVYGICDWTLFDFLDDHVVPKFR